MSIRIKLLLLLLVIALLPVGLAGWKSIQRLDQMTTSIAASTREQIIQRDRQYLVEKVDDIGNTLRLTVQSANNYLRQQQVMFELSLANSRERPADVLLSGNVARSAGAQSDTRFKQAEPDTHIVTYARPAFNIAGNKKDDPGVIDSLNRLDSVSDGLVALYQETASFSLWHYAGLANGVSVVYPGHGNYPRGYDPRLRPWYKATMAAKATTWLPMTIDASTGQPVITAAAPIRHANGTIVGATAIDLPLQRLLSFHSISQPWLNSARLALLKADQSSGKLLIVARQEPLQAASTWQSEQQPLALDSLSEEQADAIKRLPLGKSRLLETLHIDGQDYAAAITALDTNGETFLALATPHSAIENAIAAALAPLEAERIETIRQYIIGASVLGVLVVLIALLYAWRLSRPLIHMSEVTEALAEGKLDTRTGLKRSDEIGRLSVSIDSMAQRIEALQLEQEEAYRGMVTTLTRALEKKDSYTAAHSGRVVKYALRLGERIGLDTETLEKLRFGAITHDLGKIGIADAVLNKPGPLDDDEFELMKQHPTFSRTIMKPLVRFKEYAQIAGSHHEHWNGGGYPDGLKGEDIPLLARIVAISDAWDAMTGDRVYRKGMPIAKALSILDAEKDDGQFDPALIREFIGLIQDEQAQQEKQ